MDNNLKYIEEFVREFKNTLVIDFDRIVVLREYLNDDLDYYWVLQDMKGKYYHSSCVIECIALKGYIEEDSYIRLRDKFQYNLNLLNRPIV